MFTATIGTIINAIRMFMTSPSCIVEVPSNCDFTLHNIPFGIYTAAGNNVKVGKACSAIGNYVFDLDAAASAGLFDNTILKDKARQVFSQNTLNEFMSLGRPYWRAARLTVQNLLKAGNDSPLEQDAKLRDKILRPIKEIQMLLPVNVGDYTDFYSSKEHAVNVGTMFRGKDNALQPNWLHLPVGYHGRSSSIIVSGTPIFRPSGQIKLKDGPPSFGVSQKLDFELEMAFVVGVGNNLGKPISVENADEHIFGVVLMNDWSARDIQAWEYVPLGPFLGKSFGTVISPWIVTLDALEPFLAEAPSQDPPVLPYLQDTTKSAYDIQLEVAIKEEGMHEDTVVCRSNLKYLYWSFRQQLAHHTVNGCNMRPGDLCGTGTISGPTPDSYGSMLEISWNGQHTVKLNSGSERTFINDGDSVVIRGKCETSTGVRVGFGECVCPVKASPI